MDLIGHVRGIRVLCEIEAGGSFSSAADTLGLTQSAVSQHVAALERQTEMRLVERGTRPVELTQAGAALVRHGRAITGRLDSAAQELTEIRGLRHRRLRFGSFPTALTTFVPAALSRLRTQQPPITLTVVDDHMQGLLPRLRDGELDLAVIYDHVVLTEVAGVRLGLTFLFDDVFQAVLPRGHRLASRGTALGVKDLAEEPWIGGQPGSAWFRIVRDSCRTAGFDPGVALASDDYRAIQAFAAAGLGVAVLPGLAVRQPVPGVETRLLKGGPARRIWAAHPDDSFQPPAVQTMISLLQATTRRLRRPPSGH